MLLARSSPEETINTRTTVLLVMGDGWRVPVPEEYPEECCTASMSARAGYTVRCLSPAL